jgi:hypothetical protein
MLGYAEIATQADVEALFERIAGFHDSMVKELYLINRAHVDIDHSMNMNHRFDARLLVQTQWAPFAIEIVLIGIEELRTESPGEYWGATAIIKNSAAPVEKRRVLLKFDSGFEVTAERLFVRDRSDWLGPKTRLGAEVPEPNCVSAAIIVDSWRQCSSCADAFEVEPSQVFAVCPTCSRMTELLEGPSESAKASSPAGESRNCPTKSAPRFKPK